MSSQIQNPKKRKTAVEIKGTLGEKLEIIKKKKLGQSTSKLALEYGTSPQNISNIWRKRSKYESSANNIPHGALSVKPPTFPELENAVWLWFQHQNSLGVIPTGETIQEKALELAQKLDIPSENHFHASNGWLDGFKKRHRIQDTTKKGESASVDLVQPQNYMESIQERLDSYSASEIYSCDELAFYYGMLPERRLTAFPERELTAPSYPQGNKKSKQRVTVLLCASADGKDKLRPYMLGATNPPWIQKTNQSLPVEYDCNTKGWMTLVKFEEWLSRWNEKLINEGRIIALLMDNCSSHNVSKVFSNIDIIKLPRNTTPLSQPMNQSVIKTVRTKYRTKLVKWGLEKLEKTGEFPVMDLKGAINMFGDSWEEISSQTIANCFLNSAIVVPPTLTDEDCDEVVGCSNTEMVVGELPLTSDMLTADEHMCIDNKVQVHSIFDQNDLVEEIKQSNEIEAKENEVEKNEGGTNNHQVIELETDSDEPVRILTLNDAVNGLEIARNFLERSTFVNEQEFTNIRHVLQKLKFIRRKSMTQTT